MFILIYKNPQNPIMKTKLYRALYGFTDYSNNTKYKYERRGILQEGGVSKVSRNTLMIDASKIEQVKKLITELGGSFTINELKEQS